MRVPSRLVAAQAVVGPRSRRARRCLLDAWSGLAPGERPGDSGSNQSGVDALHQARIQDLQDALEQAETSAACGGCSDAHSALMRKAGEFLASGARPALAQTDASSRAAESAAGAAMDAELAALADSLGDDYALALRLHREEEENARRRQAERRARLESISGRDALAARALADAEAAELAEVSRRALSISRKDEALARALGEMAEATTVGAGAGVGAGMDAGAAARRVRDEAAQRAASERAVRDSQSRRAAELQGLDARVAPRAEPSKPRPVVALGGGGTASTFAPAQARAVPATGSGRRRSVSVRDAPAVPLFEGSAHKRGGTNSAFKRRHLTVNSHAQLLWHDNADDALAGHPPKGFIHVGSAQPDASRHGKRYRFAVVPRVADERRGSASRAAPPEREVAPPQARERARTLIIEVESERERRRWLHALEVCTLRLETDEIDQVRREILDS